MSIGFSVNYLVWLISYRSFLNVSSSSEGFYLFVDHLLDFPIQFLDILNISILASFFCPLLAIEYSSFLCFHIVPSLPVSAYFLSWTIFLLHNIWESRFLQSLSEQFSTEQLVFETFWWIFTCSYWAFFLIIGTNNFFNMWLNDLFLHFLGRIRSWAFIFYWALEFTAPSFLSWL